VKKGLSVGEVMSLKEDSTVPRITPPTPLRTDTIVHPLTSRKGQVALVADERYLNYVGHQGAQTAAHLFEAVNAIGLRKIGGNS
jgi:hypothetical protein